MAQIIHFPCPHNDMVALLEEILEDAKAGNINSFAFVATSENKDIVTTAYFNVDVAEKQYLASHIQVDAMYDIVRANLDIDEE